MSAKKKSKAVGGFVAPGCPCLSCVGMRAKGAKNPKHLSPADRALLSLRPIGKDTRVVMTVLCRGNEVLSVSVQPWPRRAA